MTLAVLLGFLLVALVTQSNTLLSQAAAAAVVDWVAGVALAGISAAQQPLTQERNLSQLLALVVLAQTQTLLLAQMVQLPACRR